MSPLATPAVAGALVIGLVVGFILGYISAKRSRRSNNQITAVQLLAVISTFLYVILTFGFGEEPDAVIALGILSIGYGAGAGKFAEKFLEGRK